MDILRVVFQAVASFVFLFIISKILGKKQIAQLEFTDYVIGISIGSIAAQMSIDPEVPYYHFLIAIFIYGLFDFCITLLSRKGVFLKKLFIGRPLIIIEQGQINYSNLKKSKLNVEELISQCRIAGYFDLAQIHYCIFEPNGQFSIMPTSTAQVPRLEDLKISKQQAELTSSLVIDGRIITKTLNRENKTSKWLFEKLDISSKAELKNIILATYTPQSEEIEIFYKNNLKSTCSK